MGIKMSKINFEKLKEVKCSEKVQMKNYIEIL